MSWKWFKRFGVIALGVLLVLTLGVWWCRVAIVSRVVERKLAGSGWGDVSFKLERVGLSSLLVRDIQVGSAEAPLAEVDLVEARYTVGDLLAGELGRLRVRGVRSEVVVGSDGRVTHPLQERLTAIAAGAAERSAPDVAALLAEMFDKYKVGEVAFYDLQLGVRLADGSECVRVLGELRAISEPPVGEGAGGVNYRVTGYLHEDKDLLRLGVDGRLDAGVGALRCRIYLWLDDLERLVGEGRRVLAEQIALVPVLPVKGSAFLRGQVAVEGWSRLTALEGVLELGRNTGFRVEGSGVELTLQTLRCEVEGSTEELALRWNGGVAGLKLAEQLQTGEQGRLMGVRGSARWQRSEGGGEKLKIVSDSDLPGRAAVRALTELVPLLPRLFTDGGTLHLEGELEREGSGEWQGGVDYTAEARRSTIALPAGRMGAGGLRAVGRGEVRESRLGVVSGTVELERGFFAGSGGRVEGDAALVLLSEPPYKQASGSITAKVRGVESFAGNQIEIGDGGLTLQGVVALEDIGSEPTWLAMFEVPAVGVNSATGASAVVWQSSVSASGRVSVSRERCQAECSVRASGSSFVSGVVSGGVEQVELRLSLPEVAADKLAEGVVGLEVAAVGIEAEGELDGGRELQLRGGVVEIEGGWSQAGGVDLRSEKVVGWQALEVAGVAVGVERATLATHQGWVNCKLGVAVAGSGCRADIDVVLPLAEPQRGGVHLRVPEFELRADGALARVVGQFNSEVGIRGGKVGVDAVARLVDEKPLVEGVLRVQEVGVAVQEVEVGGVEAEVNFLIHGDELRTSGRPWVTFATIEAGNLRFDSGRVEFTLDGSEFFMDRLAVKWCKGGLNAYSVHLNLLDPKADFTVYADRIDLGEALMMVMPFEGQVDGMLVGQFPIWVERKKVGLGRGFLYSIPGKGGKLRVDDSETMRSMLARSGIGGDVQKPLSKALSDMDFEAIRLELEPEEDGDAVLRIKLAGKSNYKEWPAPVDLNLNVRGPLESLINMGLDASRNQ